MTNPYRRGARLSWYATGALLLIGAVLTPFGGDVALIGWIIVGSLAFAAVLTAGICHFYARRADRHLEAFRGGQYLAHWTYAPEEWRTFSAAERERSRKRARWMPLWGALLGAFIGLLLLVELGAGGLVGFTLLFAAAGWGLGRFLLTSTETTYAEAHTAEAYVGQEAAVLNGKYIHWTGFGIRLIGLQLVPGTPSVLEFTVRAEGGRSSNEYKHRVPVPSGREGEAEGVISSLGF